MAWTLGGTTLAATELPHAGSFLEFVNQPRFSKFRPIGYTGAILTYLGSNEREHTLRISALVATKDSMKTLLDAHVSFKFIGPWAPFLTPGLDVIMIRMSARKNAAVTGAARWDVEMILTEI